MEKLKKCSKCGRELPVSEFWKKSAVMFMPETVRKLRGGGI